MHCSSINRSFCRIKDKGQLFCVTPNSCILNFLSSELPSAIALITVNNPELNNLPPIKLIALDAETASLSGRTASTRPPTDIRWVKVLEFLRSSNLAPNSRKLYERELKRFLGWTELHYHELRPRVVLQKSAKDKSSV